MMNGCACYCARTAFSGLISFGYFLATSLVPTSVNGTITEEFGPDALLQPQKVNGTSGYIPAVWGALTLKWGVLMMWYSHRYNSRHSQWVAHFHTLGIYEDDDDAPLVNANANAGIYEAP